MDIMLLALTHIINFLFVAYYVGSLLFIRFGKLFAFNWYTFHGFHLHN